MIRLTQILMLLTKTSLEPFPPKKPLFVHLFFFFFFLSFFSINKSKMTQVLVPFVLLSLRNGTEEIKIHNEKRREKIFKTSVALCSRPAHLLCILVGHQSPMQTYCTNRVYMEKWSEGNKSLHHILQSWNMQSNNRIWHCHFR